MLKCLNAVIPGGEGFKSLSPDRPVEATTLTMKAHFRKRLSGDNPAVWRFRSIERRGPAGPRYIRETAAQSDNAPLTPCP